MPAPTRRPRRRATSAFIREWRSWPLLLLLLGAAGCDLQTHASNGGLFDEEEFHAEASVPSTPIRADLPEVARFTNRIGMEFVLIPPGDFTMGSPHCERGRQQDEKSHRVRIGRPFYLGACEVTVGQFRRFVDATAYRTDAERDGRLRTLFNAALRRDETRGDYQWRSPGVPQGDDHPAVMLSWNDATAFCDWLGSLEGREYRLPTEAEWEYACRAGTTGRFWTGDDDGSLRGFANVLGERRTAKVVYELWGDGYLCSSPVGCFRPNGLGLYDMHGNAWEWCSDWYEAEYYARSPSVDPQGPSFGECRVLRGGSFRSVPPYVRSANRLAYPPEFQDPTTGFRVAVSAEGPRMPPSATAPSHATRR